MLRVFGQSRGYRQMSTARLEAVLVGYPVDGEGNAILGVSVGTTAGHTGVLGVDLLVRSALIHLDAVLGLKAGVREP